MCRWFQHSTSIQLVMMMLSLILDGEEEMLRCKNVRVPATQNVIRHIRRIQTYRTPPPSMQILDRFKRETTDQKLTVWYMVLTAALLHGVCRMVRRRHEKSSEVMIDVTYRQSDEEREVVAVLQKIYMCASVEFLMAVADFFLQALPQSPNATTAMVPAEKLPLKLTTDPQSDTKTGKLKLNLKPTQRDDNGV